MKNVDRDDADHSGHEGRARRWRERFHRSDSSTSRNPEDERRFTDPVRAAIITGAATIAAASITAAASFMIGGNRTPTEPPTAPAPPTLVLVYHPSQHCSYYKHNDTAGNGRGSAYACTPTDSLSRYRAWVLCHDADADADYRIDGEWMIPTQISTADCRPQSTPKTGGFDTQK